MLRIKNGAAVTPNGLEKTDIWIENGIIAHIGGEHGADEEYDASGCLLFPGFIDSHTHFQMDNGVTVTADDFASGTAAALVGGTTVIIDFATQTKEDTLKNALGQWHAMADGHCSCDYAFHMAVTDWNERTKAELLDMTDEGVSSFKAYMAYDALRLNDDELFELISEASRLGCPVGVHCELGDEVNSGVRALLDAGKTSPESHPLSRPATVEAGAVRRLAELAEKAKAPVWVVHLSSAEGLRETKLAKERGVRIIIETCPQYLTLTDEVYSRSGFEGAKFVCSPPIRGASDVSALWDAVSDGEVDIISTDHCSYTTEQKRLGENDFSKIPNGLPAVEHRAALIWHYGVNGGRIAPADFVRMLSENPAKLMGLWPRKGVLAEGADADIVVWDPEKTVTLRAEDQIQKSDYSPWEGEKLRGYARAVFLRGVLSAENGRVLKPGAGTYLHRKCALKQI